MSVNNCSFFNHVAQNGGAIYATQSSRVKIDSCIFAIFALNKARLDGGAINAIQGIIIIYLTVLYSAFSNNTAGYVRGAMSVPGSEVKIS